MPGQVLQENAKHWPGKEKALEIEQGVILWLQSKHITDTFAQPDFLFCINVEAIPASHGLRTRFRLSLNVLGKTYRTRTLWNLPFPFKDSYRS